MDAFISFKNIDKSFGENQVYKGLSLDIFKGETITIIGGSGTGKSVMLKLLLGVMPPDSGDIFFDGQNVCEMESKDLIHMRKRIGMLFQGAALFDSLTVKENVAYPLREHFDYDEDKLSRIVAEKLSVVGLPGIEEMMPADLSGGMKKRVGLARAIATDPEVILYDEPTTGLDPTNTNRIDDLILDLQKKFKVTSIVVTHDMASAFRVSDRLALIYNKKIEYVGTKDQVKNSTNKIVQQFINGQIGE
jgi:phospholipid/cholesterol/gamma-HCH transport system ATP-binding protein